MPLEDGRLVENVAERWKMIFFLTVNLRNVNVTECECTQNTTKGVSGSILSDWKLLK